MWHADNLAFNRASRFRNWYDVHLRDGSGSSCGHSTCVSICLTEDLKGKSQRNRKNRHTLEEGHATSQPLLS